MRSIRNLMLGAAVVAGGLSLGATSAQAAQFGVYVSGHASYAPQCPGPGYSWINGYYADGYWVPGRWNFVGTGGSARFDAYRDRNWNRREFRDHDRDRVRNQDRDRVHFRH